MSTDIQPSALVQMIIDARNRGWSWYRIAEKYDQDPDVVYAEYMKFMESNSTVNEAEYRMLQLNRLEKMLDALWDLGIKQGSLDHVKTMLPIIQEISKMLGLHKEKTITEIRVIEQRQVHLVVDYLDAVTDTLRQQIMETVTAKGAREKIDGKWDQWIADASERPLKAIESDSIGV